MKDRSWARNLKSDFNKLIQKIEKHESVTISEIQNLLPESNRSDIDQIYRKIRNTLPGWNGPAATQILEKEGAIEKTIYMVAVIGFYDPPDQALSIICNVLPKGGDWSLKFDFKHFYNKSALAFLRRCKYSILHNPDLLKNELDVVDISANFDLIGNYDYALEDNYDEESSP